MPQGIWLASPIILLPWYAARAPRFLPIPLLLLFLVVGPIMGLSVHLPSGHTPNALHLRVMTYNIKWAKRNAKAIEADIDRNKPDLIFMQDALGTIPGEMGRFLKGWYIDYTGQYIIASRYRLSDGAVRWISYPQHNHRVLRAVLHANDQDIVVYSCHLESPRFGLAAMRHPGQGISMLLENIDFRVKESERLANHIRSEKLPVILGGDLNSTVNSEVCKNQFAAGLKDAFSQSGTGYGYSYGATTKAGFSFVRIDHIMTSSQFRINNCWVGNEQGSDHCPIIADLELPISK